MLSNSGEVDEDFFRGQSPAYNSNKRIFSNFLERDDERGKYAVLVRELIAARLTRLIVDLDDLRAFDAELTARFLRRPMEFVAPWQAALQAYIKGRPEYSERDPEDGVQEEDEEEEEEEPLKKHRRRVRPGRPQDEFTLGFEGNFGGQRVTPRGLRSQHLGNLVMVEGIASRCSIVRPKVQRTVHYCPATNKHSEVQYHDSTSVTGLPTGSAYPTKDSDNNPLETEFGLSLYMDHQTLVVQEMPEKAPAGLLPQSVDVVLDGDLVDKCKPGDRVLVVGIYRPLPNKNQGETSGLFRAVLVANHVMHIGKQAAEQKLTEQDIRNIRVLAKRKDVFDVLGRSIAPSIYGHAFVKKALVMLLLGGNEKNLANGTHIRGDINMLMVGDPSTAKSQLLRFVLHTAPLALNTTGRGSSGVGLTAAVTMDRETGERRLEAGAMVIADRGVVCIDEFDKMSELDRVAIHEVMEQQTVTIAKAGLHMSLNARCSVVAAANPVYGTYDSSMSPQRNIQLPDSLISRFDLLFIVLDSPNASVDREVSKKVLANHRFQGKGAQEQGEYDPYVAQTRDEEASVFQRFDRLLHADMPREPGDEGRVSVLTIPFLKKYVQYAKETVVPVLTAEAAATIGGFYVKLRGGEDSSSAKSMPVTARSLETLIRLSTAHAKARLSRTVDQEDCQAAWEVLQYALHNDTGVGADDPENDDPNDADPNDADLNADPSGDQPADQDPPAGPGEGADEDEDQAEQAAQRLARPQRGRAAKRPPARATRATVAAAAAAPSAAPVPAPASMALAAGAVDIGSERMRGMQAAFGSFLSKSRSSQWAVEAVVAGMNAGGGDFRQAEVEQLLLAMQAQNKVMLAQGSVFRI